MISIADRFCRDYFYLPLQHHGSFYVDQARLLRQEVNESVGDAMAEEVVLDQHRTNHDVGEEDKTNPKDLELRFDPS
jgi:hypothetical protein